MAIREFLRVSLVVAELESGPMRMVLKLAASDGWARAGDDVERRVRMAIGPFSGLIRRVEVALRAAEGSKGVCRWCCRTTIVRKTAPTLIIEITDIDPAAAINRAIQRAARRVRDGA